MKKRKVIFLSVALLAVLAIAGVYFYLNRDVKVTEYAQIKSPAKIREVIQLSGDNEIVAIKIEPSEAEKAQKRNISYDYLQSSVEYYDGRVYMEDSNISLGPEKKSKYLKIVSYKIKNGSLVVDKEIDINKIIQEYNSDYLINSISYVYLDAERNPYARVVVLDSGNNRELLEVFVNLEDETAQLNKIENFDNSIIYTNDFFTDINFISKEVGQRMLSLDSNLIGKYTQDSFSSEKLNIYEEYPELNNVFKEEDSIAIFFDKPLSLAEIIYLMTPVGENPFSNMVIPGEYTIDGADHEVDSKEEFNQWVDESKVNIRIPK